MNIKCNVSSCTGKVSGQKHRKESRKRILEKQSEDGFEQKKVVGRKCYVTKIRTGYGGWKRSTS